LVPTSLAKSLRLFSFPLQKPRLNQTSSRGFFVFQGGLSPPNQSDQTAADDIWQETMLVAWRRFDDDDTTRPFGAWLRGIAQEQKGADGQPDFAGMNLMKARGNALERMPESLARGLGGYVPGATPNKLPGDLARFLPKGSDIIMQTHFHPTGKPQSEQAQLGLYLADRAPKQLLVPVQMPPLFRMGAGIDIDAGDANYLLHDEYELPIDIVGFEIGGHAHYICKKMKMVATPPGGTPFELLRIEDWDLDWQDQYLFKSPVSLSKGTKLTVDIIYDNGTSWRHIGTRCKRKRCVSKTDGPQPRR